VRGKQPRGQPSAPCKRRTHAKPQVNNPLTPARSFRDEDLAAERSSRLGMTWANEGRLEGCPRGTAASSEDDAACDGARWRSPLAQLSGPHANPGRGRGHRARLRRCSSGGEPCSGWAHPAGSAASPRLPSSNSSTNDQPKAAEKTSASEPGRCLPWRPSAGAVSEDDQIGRELLEALQCRDAGFEQRSGQRSGHGFRPEGQRVPPSSGIGTGAGRVQAFYLRRQLFGGRLLVLCVDFRRIRT